MIFKIQDINIYINLTYFDFIEICNTFVFGTFHC